MHISIYYIYIYTWNLKDFPMYKVLIGWLECLRIIVSGEFQDFQVFFSSWKERDEQTSRQGGVLELKTAWYFAKKEN